MDLRERIAHLDPSFLDTQDTILQDPNQLDLLAEQLDCSVAYLTGQHPFDDLAYLIEHKGTITLQLKLFLAINRLSQDILYDLNDGDFFRIVGRYVGSIERNDDGPALYYKD